MTALGKVNTREMRALAILSWLNIDSHLIFLSLECSTDEGMKFALIGYKP